MKELENDPLQRKIFDEFCHARKIGRKIIRNLDNEYTDSFSDAAEKMKGNNNNPYKNWLHNALNLCIQIYQARTVNLISGLYTKWNWKWIITQSPKSVKELAKVLL